MGRRSTAKRSARKVLARRASKARRAPPGSVADLREQLKRRTAELTEARKQQTATADVLKVISRSTFDVQTVLQTLTESAAHLCNADMATITRQGEPGQFYHGTNYNFPSDWVEYTKAFPLKAGRGTVVGRTLLEKRAVQIPDVLADPEYTHSEQQKKAGYRSFLGVPLLREGQPIGVFCLCRRTVRPFTKKQIELVSTFADQAVIAIENVRLFEEVQAKTHDLSEALTYQTGSATILKVIASSPTDVGPALNAIVESACELCEAYDAVIVLRDDGGLAVRAHYGPLRMSAQRWADDPTSVSGRAIADAAPIHLHDVLSGEGAEFPTAQAMSRHDGCRTILAVPMRGEGDAIGTIVLRRAEVKPFSDKQIALLQTFADQAVIALGNVALFEQVQARTRDLLGALQQQTATADVLKAISRSAFDLQTVLDALLTSACRLCEADIGTIRYEDGDSYRLAATYGCKPEWNKHFSGYSTKPDQSSVFGQTIIGGRTVHMPDVLADPNYKRPEAQKLMGFRAALGVPLVRDGHTFGVINLFRSGVGSFEPKQIEIVETFADQAVIAIENIRLFEEVQARTKELATSLDELRAAQDRLIQTEKLASLGQLTAGIAHEIKNPLNFINNFSALSSELIDELNGVLAPAPLADKTRAEVDELTGLLSDNLQKVVQHGRRANSIVKNMLLHSREGSGEHRLADLNALVEESLNLAYHGARAEKPLFNVTLRRDFDPEAGTVEVFPQEITRVLLNLISNGFYAVSKRAADAGTGFEPELIASTRGNSAHVEIRIRDNGTGIPPEVKEKMFNPFFTTKPAGEGTGLGLSISHDIIVKQHGGTIHVVTEPGVFTEFVVTLPRATSAHKPAGSAN